ncbi:RimJ/RimL family protein N-acetyltransferase [Deinobacterium chartae]|uniref:RimJ/RimL family protein N-acetyltransferase n=1 Tax=Deinobacterium chartae TaxID=521158 RepID=A0A841HUY2_9DEIO|nr:GNAT family N-acetyltransferase [Deinobacterium chartae]MBB6096633.1 RimJ/RimL family protein N-acetyltransferase [Deinobacterium chartae]
MPETDTARRMDLTLETERLLLRAPTVADYPDSRAMWADPGVTRFISGRPLGGEESWSRLLRNIGHWVALGFGPMVVHEKASGRFVGEVGLMNFRRDTEPALPDAPEIGWVLAPWSHGQGFAGEAVRAVLGWGDAHLGAGRTVCMIDPENAPSLAVARKCGFVPCGEASHRGARILVLERRSDVSLV